MQTILGANGVIGREVSRLLPVYTDRIRQVSRTPVGVNPSRRARTAVRSPASRNPPCLRTRSPRARALDASRPRSPSTRSDRRIPSAATSMEWEAVRRASAATSAPDRPFFPPGDPGDRWPYPGSALLWH